MEDTKSCKILLVDDVEMNLVILGEIIRNMGHEPLMALSAKEALNILRNDLPQLILLDVSMPDMSGLEFCELLKKDVYTREIPVIFISALDSAEDLSKGFEMGAVDYISKPFDPNDIKLRVGTHLKLYNVQSELEEANRRLNGVIKHQMNKTFESQKRFFGVIANMVEELDSKRTHGAVNEASMVRKLAQALMFSDEYENDISETFIETIEMAASIHDLGMISVPDSIKLKEEPLSPDEREAIKKHVLYGSEKIDLVFAGSDDVENGMIISNLVKYHHEHYDGSGYPEGLAKEDIPLEARIMAIVDVYDALVNNRCYKNAISSEEAIKEIEAGAGTIFDPTIVNVFKKIQRQFI